MNEMGWMGWRKLSDLVLPRKHQPTHCRVANTVGSTIIVVAWHRLFAYIDVPNQLHWLKASVLRYELLMYAWYTYLCTASRYRIEARDMMKYRVEGPRHLPT
ncbi:hypothetical protein GGS24DRAFT_449041 [Hypoxylon argillaceum]|nr:hypothetical protein GGS24DRAFT_449041 [Hypoxylon argillaceum]